MPDRWGSWGERVVVPLMMVLGDRVIDRRFDRTGGMFPLRIPGMGRAMLVREPDLVRDIFRLPQDVIDAAMTNRVQEPVIGAQGLSVLDGDEHREIRGLLLPPLRPRPVLGLREMTAKAAQRVLEACPKEVPFALLPRLETALLETMLGLTLSIEQPHRLRQWCRPLRELFRLANSHQMAVRSVFRRPGGLASWRAWHHHKNAGDRLIFDEIARRRQRGADHDDLLGRLMRHRDERGMPLTDDVLRDQVMSIVSAAHTAASTGMAWVFERVVRHPAVLRRLAAGADQGDADGYAGSVVYEALRVRPPVAFFGRGLRRSCELGGRRLAAGTLLVVHLRSLHRHPGLYPDPEVFDPGRWLGRRPGGYGWMPFGGGSHTCIGNHVSLLQMRIFLQVFARSAELAPADPRDEPIRYKAISGVPGHGCRIVIRPRATT